MTPNSEKRYEETVRVTKNMDTHIARKIEEFDRIYVHENTWKSADQTEAYAPVEGMRQWIFDALREIAAKAKKEEREEIKEHIGGALKQFPEMKLRSYYWGITLFDSSLTKEK